jgi:hypothetical protein
MLALLLGPGTGAPCWGSAEAVLPGPTQLAARALIPRPRPHWLQVRLIGVEAGGEGVHTNKHAATLTKGTPGVLHGSMSYLLQDDEGQVIDPHSISAGWALLRCAPRCCCNVALIRLGTSAALPTSPLLFPLASSPLISPHPPRPSCRQPPAWPAPSPSPQPLNSHPPPPAAWTTPASAPSTRSSWTSAAQSTLLSQTQRPWRASSCCPRSRVGGLRALDDAPARQLPGALPSAWFACRSPRMASAHSGCLEALPCRAATAEAAAQPGIAQLPVQPWSHPALCATGRTPRGAPAGGPGRWPRAGGGAVARQLQRLPQPRISSASAVVPARPA